MLRNVGSFVEKSPLQKVILPFSNRAKLLPQRTDNIWGNYTKQEQEKADRC